MATRVFLIDREQSIADISAGNAGNGNDTHCPNGKSSYNTSIIFRTLWRFDHDWSDMVKVTKIELVLRLSNVHTALGGSKRLRIQGLSDAFSSGGGSENSWSTSASGTRYGGPAVEGTSVEANLAGGDGDWDTIDITDCYRRYIPSYVTEPDGTGGSGKTNYGVRVSSGDETTTGQSWECYGAAHSSNPYIRVTYTTNTVPAKPVGTVPANAAILAPGVAPLFSWTGSDPDAGDVLTYYDLVTSSGANGTGNIWSTATKVSAAAYRSGWNMAGVPASGASPDGPIPVGQVVHWRVRNYDQESGVSAWSDDRTFTLDSTPLLSGLSPSAGFAPIWNLNELAVWTLGGSHAKPQVRFTYTHPLAKNMANYRVRIYSDGSTLLYTSAITPLNVPSGTVVDANVDWPLVLGTAYRWDVEAQDVDGVWSALSTRLQFKIRWGQGILANNVGATSSAHDVARGALTGTTPSAVLLYQFATDAAGTGGTVWSESISTLTKAAYLRILVRLATATVAANASLASVALHYQATPSTPDNWATTGPAGISLSRTVKRYGVWAAELAATGAGTVRLYPYRLVAGDGIPVTPGTRYAFSSWIRNSGAIGRTVRLRVMNTAMTADVVTDANFKPTGKYGWQIVNAPSVADAPDGWVRLAGVLTIPAGTSFVTPLVELVATANTQKIWVDALKFEEGDVPSMWTPGFLGDAITLDAMGVFIDRSQGGLLRLLGGDINTDVRAKLELGAKGLLFGGDTNLHSPSGGVMAANGVPLSLNTHTHTPVTTVVGASTRVLGTSQNPAVNSIIEFRHGAPGAGEDPYGFFQSGNGRLIVPSGLGGLYLYDVWMTGTAPAGTTSGQFAYAVAHLNLVTAGVAETLGRWDRFESGSDQGMHGQAVRQLVAGETLYITSHSRIVAGTTIRVAGWSLVRLATGIA